MHNQWASTAPPLLRAGWQTIPSGMVLHATSMMQRTKNSTKNTIGNIASTCLLVKLMRCIGHTPCLAHATHHISTRPSSMMVFFAGLQQLANLTLHSNKFHPMLEYSPKFS